MKNESVRVMARAKVNLALHVIGQRANGLHLLDSLVAFPEFGDELIFEKANDLSFSVSGPFGDELLKETASDSNIVIRAAKLLKENDNGVAIHLIKNLPIASGVGGGSSDAAITLQTLSRLWKKQMPKVEDLLTLGADVPVCLSNKFQWMQGIGETRVALAAPTPMWIVLANPGIKISTGTIFDLLSNKKNDKLEPLPNLIDQESFFCYLRRQRNDLEAVTSSLHPKVGEMIQIINETRNCKLCRMSGSGATCFGLYLQKEYAINAEEQIRNSFPTAWAVSARLFSVNSRHNVIS